jgi:hypothetical protein
MDTNNPKPEEKIIYPITEDTIIEILDTQFETEATPQLIEDITNELYAQDYIYSALIDCVHHTLEYNELLQRNKKAKNSKPHYIVKYKNPNAYVMDFEVVGAFLTEKDAQKYIDFQHQDEFTEHIIEKIQ